MTELDEPCPFCTGEIEISRAGMTFSWVCTEEKCDGVGIGYTNRTTLNHSLRQQN